VEIPKTSITPAELFEGQEGYHQRIVHAIQSLTQEQLNWHPAPKLRSIGELKSHFALDRQGWFVHLQPEGSLKLFQQATKIGW
jgi:hypothetical protein